MSNCPHRVFLDAHGDPATRVERDPLLRFLWEGRDILQNEPPDLLTTRLDVSRPRSVRLAATRAALDDGAPRIAGALLADGDLEAAPDYLERVTTEDGSTHYRPVEVAPTQTFSPNHGMLRTRSVLRLCLTADVLERVTGVRPATGVVLDRTGAPLVVLLPEVWNDYERAIARLRRILARQEVTEPGMISACKLCPWQDHCAHTLSVRRDLTLIAGLGPAQRHLLRQAGVPDLSALAAIDAGALATRVPTIVDRAESYVRQARVTTKNTPEILASWTPPPCGVEVSYDIEDDPQGFVYLHGLLVRERGKPETARYEGVFADPGEDEAAVWARFLAVVSALPPDAVFYTYTDYEDRHIRRLAQRYGGDEVATPLLHRTCDIYAALKRSAVLPLQNYSLKTVAPYLGFEWRDEDPGGAQSIGWWRAYREDATRNAPLRERLLAYNEDDCIATFMVRDWLEKMAAPKKG